MYKDKIISSLHKIMRDDPITNELAKASGHILDKLEESILDLYDNLFYFDSATWGLDKFEYELGINTDLDKSYDLRRSVIQAKTIGDGKLNLSVIDSICDSWKKSNVDVSFEDGNINIKFVDTGGVPEGLDDLKKQIVEIKPAHIPIVWLFSYLTLDLLESLFIDWDDLESQNLTWDELEVKVN